MSGLSRVNLTWSGSTHDKENPAVPRFDCYLQSSETKIDLDATRFSAFYGDGMLTCFRIDSDLKPGTVLDNPTYTG